MGKNTTEYNNKEILKMIKDSGKWYESDNYKIYDRAEFEILMGIKLPEEITQIQRQCDAYAWE